LGARKTIKTVKIIWRDACSSWNHDYFKLKDIKNIDTVLRESVGYLVHENSVVTTIAGDYRKREKTFGKLLTIPTPTIVKIIVLREDKTVM